MFKVKDFYFKQAKAKNVLARSYFKLEEIQKKYALLRKNDRVLDLGYFPGSWTQFIAECVGSSGKVVGIDIQAVNEKLLAQKKNVCLWQKDIFAIEELSDLEETKSFDCVVSDMAPRTTGVKLVDQSKGHFLCEQVQNKLSLFLRPGGSFTIKIFEGPDTQELINSFSQMFEKSFRFRPKSTRSCSKEFYFIGKGFLG